MKENTMVALCAENGIIGVYTSWRNAYLAMLKLYSDIGFTLVSVEHAYVNDSFTWRDVEGHTMTVYLDEVTVDDGVPLNPYEQSLR